MADKDVLVNAIDGDQVLDAELENTDAHGEHGKKKALFPCYIPRRYVVTLLLFLGTFNSFAVRVNFNVALVVMVNYTETASENSTDYCPGNSNFGNGTNTEAKGSFNWSPTMQSVLLAAYYYGYPAIQPFAGVLAEKYGSKKLILICGLTGAVCNLLLPVVAEWNVYALLVLRVLLGVGLGPFWPSMAAMIARWSPKSERTKTFAFCNSGLYIGTVVSQSVTGALCSTNFLNGWPATFYLFGLVSLLWTAAFWLLTTDTPAQHPSISVEERTLIESSAGDIKYRKPPYGKIIRSLPVWSFFIVLLMDITAYDIIFTYLPLYMKRVLKYDILASGGLASVPYVLSFFITYLSGYTADLIRNKGFLGTMWIRRIYTILGEMLPSLCLLIITFLNCERDLVVVFFILCVSLTGINNGGFNVCMFDIAPQFAGTIYGPVNGLSNIGGFVGPLAVGAITSNSGDVTSWHGVFYMAIGLYSFGTIFYCVFGSSEVQPWARPTLAEDNGGDTRRITDEHGRTSGENDDKF